MGDDTSKQRFHGVLKSPRSIISASVNSDDPNFLPNYLFVGGLYYPK
ncbi:hypothetical protein GCK32_012276, partial [Trichostrongylus colubriformis]